MPQPGTRKRPAPGAPPVTYDLPDSATYNTRSSQLAFNRDQQRAQSGTPTGGSGPLDPALAFPTSDLSGMAPQTMLRDPSNQVARRPLGNQSMVMRNSYPNGGGDAWAGAPNQQDSSWTQASADDRVEQEAVQVMENARKTRKAIPPFVQKLRSFLEDPKNFDLIRWSTAGDSFIVFDEEEFAKTLIPELFKHANYASFVRQLNMYGFHKKVGLSDNSMRASERKNKSPSEYANQFFRRDRPKWMWLISKPKTAPGKGKGSRTKQADGNPEEEDEIFDGEVTGHAMPSLDENGRPHQPLLIGQGDPSMLQEQLAAVQQELREIRDSHAAISSILRGLRQDQEQRAAQFREANDRHENSINAILTFLATVYSRNIDGHTNQNVGNLFGASMPHELGQSGSVVDVGDMSVPGFESQSGGVRRSPRRQPLLLQAPPASDAQTVHTMSAASTPADTTQLNAPTPQKTGIVNTGSPSMHHNQMPRTARAPSAPNQPLNTNGASNAATPEGDFLSMINSANAKDANQDLPNRMNFPQALSHLENANGNAPLSSSQRNGMLQLMANASGPPGADNANNAMVSPSGLNLTNSNDLNNWNADNEANLAFLERTLKEQEDKMSSVSNRLRPLSPGGAIPGLHEGAPGYAPNPGELDLDQLLNDDYFNNAPNGGGSGSMGTVFNDGGPDANSSDGFSFGDSADGPDGGSGGGGFGPLPDDGDRLVETVNNSEATSPASAAVDEVGALDEGQSPRKRQRRN